jgi:hypothetical protein
MESNMMSLIVQAGLCFDEIENLKDTTNDCGNVFGEGRHKGKHIEEEDVIPDI